MLHQLNLLTQQIIMRSKKKSPMNMIVCITFVEFVAMPYAKQR